jgi:uncharacterized repeat protein (TIGR01451 family)
MLKQFITKVLLAVLITATMTLALWSPLAFAQSNEDLGADAIVLVNSNSTYFVDFEHYIQPYLDNFGIPYTVVDISTTAVGESISDQAVIIIGHRQLDASDLYLDTTEEAHIANAIDAGTGLVNFDNDLSADGTNPRYTFVDTIFGFGYRSDPTGSGVTFTSEEGVGLRINCWEDDHQDPVLITTESTAALVDNDGAWTEFLYTSSRDYPSVLAGVDEEDYGLPVLRCYDSGIPNGEYEVVANLYTSGSGRDMRYYYGFTPGDPKAYSVDTVGGAGGADQHEEYSLGTVEITDGTFDIYAQDADLLGGEYPFFGWAWVRLVPIDAPPPEMHYITERHEAGESISTGNMTLVDVTLPTDVEAIAMSGSLPFLAVSTHGQGRAVQWGSYDWMSHDVLGPVYGLDDLVWRSIVWAARKPFVMQGLPPFVTMRVDDESGPFWWIDIANEFDIKPWAGLFFHNIDSSEAEHLSSLVHDGLATTSIHAFNGGFFYYNHSGSDWPDDVMADHYAEGTQWHEDNDIPISKFVLPHYYEIGTNAFQGLSDWDVEFVGTMMDPGTRYGDPWLVGGPYRRHASRQSSRYGGPVYYADFLTVPGHPEFDGQFFNCVTEIRDDAGYEWYPDNDVPGSIGRGTRQTIRALDSMVLATLFTHGQHIYDITPDNWRAILDGITTNLEPYDPIYVTLDHACQYVRAMHTSDITDSTYDPATRQLTTTLGGETDMPTMFYLFTERDGEIQHVLVDAPTFSGSTEVIYQIAGPLDQIVVGPETAEVVTGADQQFTAEGYDADGTSIPNLSFTWSITNGGGTIDADGLFTAGSVPGIYTDTVVAAYGGTEGYATVNVVEPSLDHFTFDPIEETQYVDIPFSVTITARDASGGVLTTYDGQADLSDSTGTISPTVTGAFSNGTWTGDATIGQAAEGVTITVQDGAATGTSAAFDVEAIPSFYEVTSDAYVQTAGEPFTVTVTAYEGTQFYCADDDHQDPELTTFTDSDLFDDTDGEWDEFLWVGHRDYAGVFGGIPEALSGTLELMRFYAYVPNGTYRVIANLYHSRDWRYYWGYTPDDPRAYAIDVTTGPTGDFAEFELGTVTVTDSLFELYTDYAEDLGGTAFEYFGWGWIRLEPVTADVQIDAWDNDHQDPVLTTTTDASDLDETDGEWTEFHYVSGGRPYPSVMAGVDEENSGLPTMRFYADGITNGEYEVIANLYTAGSGRDMRYYYGYTAADPKAEYVDTVGGAGSAVEQHAEYSLGTVNITDGTFDIYVQDADLLPSASNDYPFFGWAHIRLVPTGLTMSSSSATMLFDGDEDGIFGEIGDNVKALENNSFDILARDTTADTNVSIIATDNLGQSGSNRYDILPNTATALEITPAEETASAGQSVTYYARAEDAYGNTWDVTAETTFAILESGHNGTWTGGSDYTTHTAGDWTVTADYDGVTDTATLHVEPAIDLAVTKTGALDTVTVGDLLTYTIVLTNAGPATASDVTLTDTLPTALALHSVTPSQGNGCSATTPITCDLGLLADDATATVTLVVTATESGVFTNDVESTGSDPFGNRVSSTDQAGVEVINPNIQIVKTGPATAVLPNANVAFTITVTNLGDVELTNVQVEDPEVSACDAHLGTLAVGEEQRYTCQAVNVTASFTNTATVEALTTLGDPVRDTDAASVIVAAPAFTVIKEASTTEATVGDVITYTYTVENTGNVRLSGITADDDKLGAISLSPSELVPGATATGAATYTVQDTDLLGPITNTVTVSGTPPVGEVITITDIVTVTVKAASPTQPPHQIYLPLVAQNHAPPAPDLVVETITVTSNDIQVLIKNQGAAPVLQKDAFWVDLYVNPNPIPADVNQTWDDGRCTEGAVWGVTGPALPLAPGDAITLTIGDAYHWSAYSNLVEIPSPNTPLYAQVDSANTGTNYGAVLESHELAEGYYNNIIGPAYSTNVTMENAAKSLRSFSKEFPFTSNRLPQRP